MKHKERIITSLILCLFFGGTIAYLFSLLFFYSSWLWDNDFRYILTLLSTPFVIGGLLIIFFVFFYFNKRYKIFIKKNIIILFTIFFTVLFISFVSTRLLIKRNYNIFYTFTSEKWENTAIDDRYHLIPSFEKQYNLIGVSYETVILLLGEPDNEGPTYCSYYLGFGHGIINIDPLYYYISFDENFIVTETGVYQS